MKYFLISLLILGGITAKAQYYYKDILGTQQINANYQLFIANKVSAVNLSSYVGNKPVTEGFSGTQQIYPAQNKVVTITKTAEDGETTFTAFYNAQGFIIQSVDSTTSGSSTSTYNYDAQNRLIVLSNSSRSAGLTSTEVHTWQYNAKGQPVEMKRIRNNSDTTVVSFVTDEKGNVTEERATKNGIAHPTVFYYYDDKKRLTDIVRYNVKVKRMLPDYMFEYEDSGELSSMTVVPEGSSDYQKWYYTYDENGLKLAEFCYNKRNELLGKIEYQYTYKK